MNGNTAAQSGVILIKGELFVLRIRSLIHYNTVLYNISILIRIFRQSIRGCKIIP